MESGGIVNQVLVEGNAISAFEVVEDKIFSGDSYFAVFSGCLSVVNGDLVISGAADGDAFAADQDAAGGFVIVNVKNRHVVRLRFNLV